MTRGGKRDGAGGKSTWEHGKTKSIRVPIALAEEILQIARQLDQGTKLGWPSSTDATPLPLKLQKEVDLSTLTVSKGHNSSNKAIIEPETESKVLDLSGISIKQHDGAISVHLEDLVKAGYKIRPEKIAQLVEARIQKLKVDNRLKYGNNPRI